jgi:tRNA pseudouridine55 synthase
MREGYMSVSPYHGLLVLDKPAGITSRTAVDRASGWFPRGTKIGHTGTLDPLATGVLVICVGVATRLAEYVQDMTKTYRTEILLGATSDTDDADGTITPDPDAVVPEPMAIEAALAEFFGTIEQVPPAYSAAKLAGRRAHELARKGHEVTLQPRTVRIHGIDLLDYTYPKLELEVRCGKGTYIRSLARDLGRRLGCGALVKTLSRIRVGPFLVSAGIALDADSAAARSRLLPVSAAVACLPRVIVSEAQAEQLRHGQAITWRGEALSDGGDVAVFDEMEKLVGVARAQKQGKMLRPEKVLAM